LRTAEDKPNKPLPANAPTEITGNLAAYAGNGFKCGTTFLMGFPELWNPHALNGNGVPAKLTPSQFRVVAVSETPSDLIVPPMDPGDPLDKGFSNLPKQGNLPKTDATSRLWMQFVNNGWFDFCIQPVGHFAYMFPNASANQWTPTWLHDDHVGQHANFAHMGLNGTSWTWDWPFDSLADHEPALGPLTTTTGLVGSFLVRGFQAAKKGRVPGHSQPGGPLFHHTNTHVEDPGRDHDR
jgi:hypothetical protein